MGEHLGIVLILGLISGFITAMANSVFGQTWGALQFFVIWLVLTVMVYGGFVYLDGDIF